MTPRPDMEEVRVFLARVSRRLDWMQAVRGAAMMYVIVALGIVMGGARHTTLQRSMVAGVLVGMGGCLAGLIIWWSRRHNTARLIELRAPQCRNLLVTAAELWNSGSGNTEGGTAPSEYVHGLVFRDAAKVIRTLHPAELFPARGTFAALALGVALFGLTTARTAADGKRAIVTGSVMPAIDGVDITITPPVYSGQKSQTVHDPARIEALIGSRLHVRVRAQATTVVGSTLHGKQDFIGSPESDFSGDVVLDADGFLAIEPSSNGHAGARRLIGLAAIEDHAPKVRVTAPGRDLQLLTGHKTLDIAVEADDDIGLASLRLRYTIVSGSGERFTFKDGETALSIERTDAQHWKAHTSWKLDPLGLEAGDLVVYRAVAADHRPGAAPVESDSWIAEVMAPGGMALGGFSIDPDQERYALSQQMVILKTERLQARKATMTAEAFADSVADLAVEQRRVRAEFVFMMGGEVGGVDDPVADPTTLDETAEANSEGDLAAGRMLNQGRDALLRSIRFMSRAAKYLTSADITSALPDEKSALAQLERAFSHTRIILRALTEHERLDFSRRMTGVLAEASRDNRAIPEPQPDARVTELRRALAGIASLAGGSQFDGDAAARTSSLAEGLLRLDPASEPLRQVAAQLMDAASAIGRKQNEVARQKLDGAASGLAQALSSEFLTAPQQPSSLDFGRLRGARADALRRGPGTP